MLKGVTKETIYSGMLCRPIIYKELRAILAAESLHLLVKPTH
ncbi:MAG TPA: hypothetical protein VFZ55_03500 [Nitrososphaera sp.]